MRKTGAGKVDWVKHSRNARPGKRGVNKRERRLGKRLLRTTPVKEIDDVHCNILGK